MSLNTPHVNPYVIDMIEQELLEIRFCYTAELDEFWSFVHNKNNQRWTWYVIDKRSGIILAWHNGKRTDTDFLKLMYDLSEISIRNLLLRQLGFLFQIFTFA